MRAAAWSTRSAVALIALVTSLGVMPNRVPAQSSGLIAPVARSERWFSEVPVSGHLRVGLMFPMPAHDGLPRAMFAWLPGGGSSKLCVEISSRDGRYVGEYVYELARSIPGMVGLEWVTERSGELARYDVADLAILARLTSDCDGSDGEYVVSAWSAAADRREAVVLLNSDEPSSLVLVERGKVLEEVRCRDIQGAARAFNLRCPLPARWMSDHGPEIFVRVREVAGRRVRLRDLPFPIAGR